MYKNDFTCLYCNNNFPSPKAQLRFEVELFGRTGSLNAFIEEKEAETILGISTEEVIDADMENKELNPNQINHTLKDTQWLFHIRTTTFDIRGKKTVRHTIISCLPLTESTSTSQAPRQESSASDSQQTSETDVAMLESDQTTSEIQKTPPSTTHIAHPSKPTSKRGIDSTKGPSAKTLKHTKQD
ncbi:hypothetical protein ACS0TY_021398 [Phlomoides rotata]